MKKFVAKIIILLLVGSSFSMLEITVGAQEIEQVSQLAVPYVYQCDTY